MFQQNQFLIMNHLHFCSGCKLIEKISIKKIKLLWANYIKLQLFHVAYFAQLVCTFISLLFAAAICLWVLPQSSCCKTNFQWLGETAVHVFALLIGILHLHLLFSSTCNYFQTSVIFLPTLWPPDTLFLCRTFSFSLSPSDSVGNPLIYTWRDVTNEANSFPFGLILGSCSQKGLRKSWDS